MDFHLIDKNEPGYGAFISDATILDQNIRAWTSESLPTCVEHWPDWRWNQIQMVPRSIKEAFGGGAHGAGEILRNFVPDEEPEPKIDVQLLFKYFAYMTLFLSVGGIAIAAALTV
jgi:hypothetical protein